MQFDRLRRREFLSVLGGAAVAWPVAASAQQRPLPLVGFLDAASAEERTALVAAFRQGLTDGGYVVGQNAAIEFRWADGKYDRLSTLAAELVRRPVNVIAVPSSGQAALAAKSATATIPIVFGTGADPVKLGLVSSLNRPGGNITGVSFLSVELRAKRMQFLREFVPSADRLAVLINPTDVTNESAVRDVETAAGGRQVLTFEATNINQIDEAFANIVRAKAGALFIEGSALFDGRRVQLAILAARHAIPAAHTLRSFVEAGGLMSYGSDITDSWRQVGLYTTRVLRGAKPADLPVVQPTKFELAINLSTARALGLDVPPTLLAIADEIIE
jgi:putative ABC transport system substrate-binding protein